MLEAGNSAVRKQSLSIRLGTDGFSFSLYAPYQTEGVYREADYALHPAVSLSDNLFEALNTTELLKEEYARARVLVDRPFTCVPAEQFYEEEAEVIYRHAFPDCEYVHVLHNALPVLNCVELFAIETELYEILLERFPKAHYYSSNTGVMEHLQRRSKIGERRKLYAHFHGKLLSAYHFKGGELLFVNTFEAVEPADVAYYLLSVWQQLQLDQEKDELHILGTPFNQYGQTELLKKYLRNVFVIHPAAEFNRAQLAKVDGVPYDLLTLLLGGM